MANTLPQSTAEFCQLYSAFMNKEVSSPKKGTDVRREIVQQSIEGRLAAFLLIRRCRKRAAAIKATQETESMKEKTTKKSTKCCAVM
ncbi:unnamed protein product [Caenorhabditis nigoni]